MKAKRTAAWIVGLLLLLASVIALRAAETDVIVYGSTPGGFCAAIAAAREGASVILLEPTDHVGGLSTGGLSHCDSNQMRRETLMGLFDEWHRRVVKDYTDRGLKAPYNPAIKDTAKWTFEPHVALRVTMQMLKEAGVTVLTNRYLKSVTKDGTRITALVTKDGTFKARVFVDGSYEGDLMAAARVDWTIGRESRAEFGESHAGKQYPKPKPKMKINGFDAAGNLLPLVTTSDPGPDDAGDKHIMTYSFRLCLTRDPDNKVPMPVPANYDPARFELARRMLKAGIKVGFDLYPLPGEKFDGNNSIYGQLSLGLVGGCNDWHSADEAGRAKIWEAHKQYTLEFIHFLRTDSAVPKKIRAEFADLGLCKDEFAATGHFPPALYVRESRRMKGMYMISQKDILISPEKDDPIAISSFPIDSHDCQRVALKDGGVINEGTIFPVRVPGTKLGYAYQVPYRSVLPPAGQCNNLLVPVALSCTHVAMCSLRIEGAWMVIGQGAGVAAARAAKQGVAVQDLPYPILRERLLAQGQVLKLPAAPNAPLAVQPATDSKPNIVLILADDLGYGSLGCYGSAEVKTPNIDRLAASGVRFTDFHSNGAMCSPTRASLMTGRYQQRCAWVPDEELSPIFQAQRNENTKQRWAWGISTNELTLPEVLRQAGYHTALIGKWHLGYDFNFHPMNYGFDEFRGYVGGNVDYHTHVAGYGLKEVDWWRDKQIQNEPGYTTDLLAKYATDFIERNKAKPFFLYLAHEAPHDPWQGRGANSKKSPAETYKEMLTVLDESVGAVVATLLKNHLETNTLVIFCSDNGPAAPRGFPANGILQGKKGSMLEGGHRVPFIANWPGVIAGGRTNRDVVMTMDFLPTFAQLAGATIPSGHKFDGVDLMPLLKSDAQIADRVLYWMSGEDWGVRKGAWKLIGKGNEAQTLVNLADDLSEKNNLINEKPELADELMKLHRQWIAEVGNK